MNKEYESVFSRLTEWRNFPNYQLERRLDIFISLYVKELLEARLWPLREIIIPEFPISRKTLGETVGLHKTVKVDYVLFPMDYKDPIVFLELKTDNGSVRDEQIDYLVKAKQSGIKGILNDLTLVYSKSKSKEKYTYLINKLDESGLTKTTWEKNKRSKITSVPKINVIQDTKICLAILSPFKPSGLDGFEKFDFNDFKNILNGKDDEISRSLNNILNVINGC